jgi:hypothetical protein
MNVGRLHGHSEPKNALHITTLAIMFIIASVFLYVGIALCLFVPSSRPYTVGQQILPFSFFTLAAVLDLLIARLMSRFTGRSYAMSLAKSSAVVLVGTILTSMAVMRENWLEIMKELAQQA